MWTEITSEKKSSWLLLSDSTRTAWKKYHCKEKTKNVPPFITKQRAKIYNIFIKILQKYEHSHIFCFFGKKIICSLPLGVCYCFVSCICFGCKTKIFSLSEFFVFLNWQKKAADRKNSEKKQKTVNNSEWDERKVHWRKLPVFRWFAKKNLQQKYTVIYTCTSIRLWQKYCAVSLLLLLKQFFEMAKKNKAT